MRNPVTVACLARGAELIVTNAGTGGTRRGPAPTGTFARPVSGRRYFARPSVNATAGYETKW